MSQAYRMKHTIGKAGLLLHATSHYHIFTKNNRPMGAWGHGIFDDDTAMDTVVEISHSEHPHQFFAAAFDNALETDNLEYDDCHAVIISAAFMDALLNGTPYIIEGCEDDDYLGTFARKQIALNVTDLKPIAIEALQVVLSDKSELKELWAENEELYPLWKANVEGLVERLK